MVQFRQVLIPRFDLVEVGEDVVPGRGVAARGELLRPGPVPADQLSEDGETAAADVPALPGRAVGPGGGAQQHRVLHTAAHSVVRRGRWTDYLQPAEPGGEGRPWWELPLRHPVQGRERGPGEGELLSLEVIEVGSMPISTFPYDCLSL